MKRLQHLKLTKMIKPNIKNVYYPSLLLSLICYALFGHPLFGILFLMLLLYGIIGLILLLVSSPSISIAISGDDEMKIGEEGKVFLEVLSDSKMPIWRCDITIDSFNNLNSDDRKTLITSSLLNGKRKNDVPNEGIYELCFASNHYGIIDNSVFSACIKDPLGVFSKDITVDSNMKKIAIVPEITNLGISPYDYEHYDMDSFRYADGKIGGDSSETIGIREYITGDDSKRIHWKLTAKEDRPMVKEFGLPVDSRVLVLVDKRIPKESDSQDYLDDVDRLIELALSFSYSLLESDLNHTVCWERDKELCFSDVNSEDSFYTYLTSLMESSVVDDSWDPVRTFLSYRDKNNFGSYLIITLNGDSIAYDCINLLSEYGNVDIITPESFK